MIRIDPEFQSLIPPLSDDEFRQLEENCVQDGIRDPLVVWHVPNGDDILIDGHNRFKIAANHGGIPFDVKRMRFDVRNDVKAWIIKNQFGRRNLSAYDRSILALKLKPVIAEQAKAQQVRKSVSQKSVEQKPIDTQKELAKVAGVSHDTIHKVETIEKKATDRTRQLVREGKLSINQAYNSVAPKRPDPVKQAKEEHADFVEKKQEKVVSMDDIQMDKLNKKIVNSAMLQDVLSLLNRIDDFGLKHKAEDLQELRDMADEVQLKIISGRCIDCQKVLMRIAVNIT